MRRLALLATAALVLAATEARATGIYWTSQGNDNIYRANLDGSSKTALETGLGNPYGIGLDVANNKMYWADNGNHTIASAALAGGAITNIETGLVVPLGLAVDPGSAVYWVDRDAGKAQKSGLAGGAITDLTQGISPVVNAGYGVAIDKTHGLLYFSEGSNSRIRKMSMTTPQAPSDFLTGLGTPQSIAIDSFHQWLYFADSGTNKISRVNLDGTGGVTDIVTFGSSITVYGLAVDAGAGEIYWTEYANQRIGRATATAGATADYFMTGLAGNPTGLALGVPPPVVPEPGTLALAGVGLLAALRRRFGPS